MMNKPNNQNNYRPRMIALLVFLAVYLVVSRQIFAYEQRHFAILPYFIWTWIWSFLLSCILFWDHVRSLLRKGKFKVDFLGILAGLLIIILVFIFPEYFWPNAAVISVIGPIFWTILLHSITRKPPDNPD